MLTIDVHRCRIHISPAHVVATHLHIPETCLTSSFCCLWCTLTATRSLGRNMWNVAVEAFHGTTRQEFLRCVHSGEQVIATVEAHYG